AAADDRGQERLELELRRAFFGVTAAALLLAGRALHQTRRIGLDDVLGGGAVARLALHVGKAGQSGGDVTGHAGGGFLVVVLGQRRERVRVLALLPERDLGGVAAHARIDAGVSHAAAGRGGQRRLRRGQLGDLLPVDGHQLGYFAVVGNLGAEGDLFVLHP